MNTRGIKQDTYNKKTVFVGLSGGVDSAVSAGLLKTKGYNVVGVFMKTWQPDFVECTWKDERRDAMRAAAKLDIPFLTFDFENEYKEKVADYMINEYRNGRTPNPDVMCNKEVKFGAFYKRAKELGADFIATGHYARNILGNLYAGIDNEKDQSYFIWGIQKEILNDVIFPLGELKKDDVRKIARKLDLPQAEKKDSQGVCFIGPIDMKDFLKHYIDSKQGDVLDIDGNVIGIHEGALFYTLGERHGFKILSKSPTDMPYYIVGKDVDKNTITVSHDKITRDIDKSVIKIRNTNWFVIPKEGQKLSARWRYRQKLNDAEIIVINDDGPSIKVSNGDNTIASGQSLVIYDNDMVIGGGIIL